MAAAVKGSSFSTLEDFETVYRVRVDQVFVELVDRETDGVKAQLEKREENRHHTLKSVNPGIVHFNNGIYYFVLESTKYKANYVYSYHLGQNRLNHVYGPASNPEFFKDRMVEFATGFTRPGPQEDSIQFRTGEAALLIYALTHPKFTKVGHYIVKGGGGSGWDGSIDEEKEVAVAFDYVTGKSQSFPLFQKV